MNFDYNIYKKRFTTFSSDLEDYSKCEDKCDTVGFVPLSVQISKMKSQGELTKIMNDFLTDRYARDLCGLSEEDINNTPISLLNAKHLDKVDLTNLYESRFKEYMRLKSEYDEKLKAYKGVTENTSEPPQTESE